MSNRSAYWNFSFTARIPRCPVRLSRPQLPVPPALHKKKELIEYGLVDERVWKYDFSPTKAELVPEPDNPEDPKAIKVLVDGVHVGYIKAGSCAHLLKVIREDRIVRIECKMYGGPYKYVSEELDYVKDKFIYEFEKSEVSYGVTLTITEK